MLLCMHQPVYHKCNITWIYKTYIKLVYFGQYSAVSRSCTKSKNPTTLVACSFASTHCMSQTESHLAFGLVTFASTSFSRGIMRIFDDDGFLLWYTQCSVVNKGRVWEESYWPMRHAIMTCLSVSGAGFNITSGYAPGFPPAEPVSKHVRSL